MRESPPPPHSAQEAGGGDRAASPPASMGLIPSLLKQDSFSAASSQTKLGQDWSPNAESYGAQSSSNSTSQALPQSRRVTNHSSVYFLLVLLPDSWAWL